MSMNRRSVSPKEKSQEELRHRSTGRFSGGALTVIFVCALISAAVIGVHWSQAMREAGNLAQISFITYTIPAASATPRAKPTAQSAKGLYLTAHSANSPKKLQEIINLINETELNAVVIDIKDYTGYVLYDSRVPLVRRLRTKRAVMEEVAKIIKTLHEHGVYVIARQTVFQDPILAEKKPEWAIKDVRGGVWRDHKGLSWVDPTRPEVWKYNTDIAREAINLGFDEINFDYVRFPSDGDMRRVVYNLQGKKKFQVMGEFYKYLSESLAPEPAWLSLDMFGLTMEATSTNDMNIGQRIVDAVDHTDYISPMMYPSHYPRGHLGLSNPAAHPAEVFEHGLKLGSPKFAGARAKVRPWIQAFNIGATYDGAKIRAQIDAIERYSDAGFLVWNASNRYSADGFNFEE